MLHASHTAAGMAPSAGNSSATRGPRDDESAMVAALKAGNEDAYLWLFERYSKNIYNFMYRSLQDAGDAHDTTQEVFIKVCRGVSTFNGGSSLKTWMYRIAIHEASNRRRWYQRHRAMETSIEEEDNTRDRSTTGLADRLHDNGESPYEHAARHQMRTRMEWALRTLPEHYRRAVVLRDIYDLSYEEIAERTASRVGTVKSRLVRGRQALREHLQLYAASYRTLRS
jgi:RNA polymerase sigma-70 factor (ECF subfamily)